jgi:hypothetical protein
VVLGNKCDQDGGQARQVTEKRAKQWCATKGDIPYFEVSAKENVGVEGAFATVARLAVRQQPQVSREGRTCLILHFFFIIYTSYLIFSRFLFLFSCKLK